jgi:Ca-activated chloride channel family protein
MYLKKFIICLSGLFWILLGVKFCEAQSTQNVNKEPLTRILFIFDASNSMWGTWQSDKKIHIANRLLSKMIDSLENYDNLELALRVYGHQYDFRQNDCSDTKLEVPFAANNFDKIKQKLRTITPKGMTPISLSLQACAADFPTTENCRNIVILITDGIEECLSDPCEVSKSLQSKGIILKPFIIGIGADFSKNLECAGQYLDAGSEISFDNALGIVIQQIFNKTTAQVNLLDANGLPTESNVNMTFFNDISHEVKYRYIHTFNPRGLPDTLYLDPMVEYGLKVHTIPPVEVHGIQLTAGKHTIIPVDVPQGNLLVRIAPKSNKYQNVPILVRESGKSEIINVQYFYKADKYLTGKYDIEILCLPRLKMRNISISQSYTTAIELQSPGIAVIKKNELGFGSLYHINEGKDEWIYNLREEDIQESILLQPGKYRILFRKNREYQTINTREVVFTIKSDETTNVIIPR